VYSNRPGIAKLLRLVPPGETQPRSGEQCAKRLFMLRRPAKLLAQAGVTCYCIIKLFTPRQKRACVELLKTSNLAYDKFADIPGHPQSEDALQLARQRFHPPDDGLVV
jgi:hypothetical protein